MSDRSPQAAPPGAAEPMIRLVGVGKTYPDGTVAVQELDLDVPRGRTVCLVGPSGCGKSTTLKMVNRLIEPTSGRIFIDGEDITRGDPVELRRRIGYVIQQVGPVPAPEHPHQRRDRARPCSAGTGSGPPPAPTSCSTWSGSTRRSTPPASPTSSPAVSASGSGWPGRWRRTRRCC